MSSKRELLNIGNIKKAVALDVNKLSDFTSPAGTPTQIRSTAALFLPTYICAEKAERQ